MQESLFQPRGDKILLGRGLIGEIAANEEEYGHVHLLDEFENERSIQPANTHGDYMPHHHQEDSNAFQEVEIFNSMPLRLFKLSHIKGILK